MGTTELKWTDGQSDGQVYIYILRHDGRPL